MDGDDVAAGWAVALAERNLDPLAHLDAVSQPGRDGVIEHAINALLECNARKRTRRKRVRRFRSVLFFAKQRRRLHPAPKSQAPTNAFDQAASFFVARVFKPMFSAADLPFSVNLTKSVPNGGFPLRTPTGC